jgi:hypothetical protein
MSIRALSSIHKIYFKTFILQPIRYKMSTYRLIQRHTIIRFKKN